MTEPLFGCPYHGLVQNGEVGLPNSSTRTYPQPAGIELGATGITQRLRGVNARVPARTQEEAAKDTANGWQWLDYALVSGRNGQTCGQELGEHWHLYADPSGKVWRMTAELYVTSNQVRVRVRLKNLYGHFPKRFEDVDREVLSADFSLPNGETDQSEYVAAPPYLRAPERNSHGSVMLFHLYWGEVDSNWSDFEENGFPYSQRLRAVYKVQLSGSGDVSSQGTLGAGIGGSAVLYKDLGDIQTDLGYDDSTTIEVPTWSCAPTSCSDTMNLTVFDLHGINKEVVRFVFDETDQEVEISYRDESHVVTDTLWRTRTDCPGASCTLEQLNEVTNTRKFNLYRDDILIAESGDYVIDSYQYKLNSTTDTLITITWRGLTLRNTTEDLIASDHPDVVVGDHPDGVNIRESIAFISPQIIGVLVKQGTRAGPGNFTLKRVHLGPAVAAEAEDLDIEIFDPTAVNWWTSVYGSYEPVNLSLTRATDSAVCYV